MSSKQSILNNYFGRRTGSESESGNDFDNESVYLPSKSKRLYDQPMSWTRVKNVEQAVNQRVMVFDVEQDLLTDKNLKQIRKDSVRQTRTLLFDPESFKAMEDELTIQNHELSREQLLGYAKTAAKIRSDISQKVRAMTDGSRSLNADPVLDV